MTQSADLDVVVLGGGGHVGLPLSLAFAKAGLRVGIYDTNQATLDRIAAGEMPFLETGADDLLREILADRSPRVRRRRRDDRADGSARRRHRHAGRRVPRSVDDDLREGRRPDRAAPARAAPWSSCGAPSTRARPATSPSTCADAAATSTSRSARSGSPRATRSRSCTRCPRSSARTTTSPPSGRPPCSATSPPRRSGRRPRKPSSRSCSPTRGAT